MMKKNTLALLLSLGLALGSGAGLTACSFAPTYERPELTLPESWNDESRSTGEAGEILALHWWERFNDPVLNKLVEEAFEHNRDLEAATARLEKAGAALGLSRAEMFPNVMGIGSALTGYSNGTRLRGETQTVTAFNGLIQASWEPDLWGRLRNATAAARAQMLASDALLRGTALSLAGNVTQSYFTLLTLDAKIRIAERTLKTREQGLAIYTDRFSEGIISELDLTQAQTVVETARIAMFQLREAREQAEGALAVLLGRTPTEVLQGRAPRGDELEQIPSPPLLPRDLPANILTRRPDIVAAEQSLIAANANIGVARAAWLPSFSLSAAFGVHDTYDLGNLLRHGDTVANLGGNVTLPIFDFGRILANVRMSEAVKREMAASYEKTVQNAFADVRSALASQIQTALVVESSERQTGQFRLALDLASSRYDSGQSSYLDVLDAERSLFSAELNLADARYNRLMSVVRLCLALGGGWEEQAEDGTQKNPTETN